jgi:uncharacterized membrane protein YkoI
MNMKMAGSAAVVVLILIVGGWQLSKQMTSAQPLTEAEAEAKVKELYPGKMVELSKQQGLYVMAIDRDEGIYEVEMDSVTGEIVSMKRTKEYKPVEPQGNEQAPEEPSQPEKEPPSSGSPTTNEPPSTSANLITQEEATAIALKRFGGEIDDIEQVEKSGISFYLLEVETEDDREVTVEINAISGEITNLTWED